MKTTFPFTQKRIMALQPDTKTKVYSDLRTVNLKITVTAQGTKTYYCRFKVDNQSLNIKIGDALAISLDDARARSVELMNFHRQKSLTNKSLSKSPLFKLTLNQVFQLYKKGELGHKPTVAGRTHSMEVAYNKHIKPSLGKELFSNVTKKAARQFFKDLESKGYGVHNKCLSVLKASVNYVIDYEEELEVTTNPFERLKKMSGVSRSRYLTHDEARLLLNALNQVKNQAIADVYRLALFTGARLSNVKSMRWNDINLSGAVWLIPASKTKTKQYYEIPLHDYVLNILHQRRESSTSSDFVFCSRTSKYGYMTGGDPIWKQAITMAGLYHENPNIRPRPHDLRRTFATWQIQSGADISVVSKALCHTSLKHTLVYAHTNVNQVRQAIDSAFSFLN